MNFRIPGRVSLLILAPLFSSWLCGCGPAVDLEAERAELMRIHELSREAHLGKDAAAIAALVSDDFLNISHGEIDHWTSEEVISHLQPYLDRSTFLAWDDIQEPVIRISSDGTMAYVVILKDVHLTQPDENGDPVEGRTIFAWTETYEKRDGEWRLTTVTSTNKPGEM
jgi:ketosteroid isomerase-like protein